MTRLSRRMLIQAVLAATMAGAAPAVANPLLSMFKRVDADPAKDYSVKETHGPWMIMVTVFRGEKAKDNAKLLVVELRKSLGVQAYSHEKVSDYTTKWEGNHVAPSGAKDKWQYAHQEVLREVAVLVGDFANLEDPDAAATLKRIKAFEPQTVKVGMSSDGNLTTAELERYRTQLNRAKNRGPLSGAFLATNPLLKKEYFQQHQGIDKLVMQMNEGAEHSLLNCPGKYTVKIATFRGATILEQNKVRAIESNKVNLQSKLAEAGEHALLLTMALRKQGFEAYQFHDRHESIVCVGSFNEVGTPRKDGKTEINPGIHKIMEFFGAQKDQSRLQMGATNAITPRTITVVENGEKIRLALDFQPLPIMVPRPTVTAAYQR